MHARVKRVCMHHNATLTAGVARAGRRMMETRCAFGTASSPSTSSSSNANLPVSETVPISTSSSSSSSLVALGRKKKKRFPTLRPDDFRHPLDRQNTSLLRAVPGLQQLTRFAMGPITEELMVFDNVASSILVSAEQLPAMHRLLEQACRVLAVSEPPELYIKQSPSVNAYTLAVEGRKPFIVLHTALVELLNEKELQAVIAHELSHIKCDHGTWLTCANLVLMSVNVLPFGGALSRRIEDGLLSWYRAAELTCDRGALLVTQDHLVVISAMMKMAGGTKAIADNLNVDAFLAQARILERNSASSPLGWWVANSRSRAMTHPVPVLRAREVDKWAASAEYKKIVRNGRDDEDYAAELIPPSPSSSSTPSAAASSS